jgi:signal transduction histidine kinase
MVSYDPALTLWNSYAKYVRKKVLPNNIDDSKDIAYWRNEIFLKILTFLAPLSIIAMIPSVYMSFRNGIPVVAFTDLVSFGLVIMVMVYPRMATWLRKSIFILMLYSLSVIVLYYLDRPGPGLLFLLTSTLLSSIIYSASAGYYSAWVNIFICGCFGLCILFRVNTRIVADYNLGTWIAITCTVAFISFLCAECLKMLLKGLKSSMDDSKTLAANLTSIIESTDAYIYSIDRDFRYITSNQVMKNVVKQSYNIELKPGDNIFEFLVKSSPEEALFWKNIYTEALSGKAVKFEKDFSFDGHNSTTAFSFNAIIKNDEVVGLSCFAVDITERINAQREIQKLNEELEIKVAERTAQLLASNKDLEAFSYSVSHDLRAPLRAVNGYAQMLKEDYSALLNPSADRVINNIIDHAKKMGRLIDDLLAFSRFGRRELVKVNIPVQEMVENICNELKIENSGRAIQFRIANLMPAIGDSMAINQVWVNLISNAVKYTMHKPEAIIEIGSEQKGDEIIYHIKDNGAGFDMRYADKLFGVFQRLHSNEEFEGTGVGLAIVHRIICKHGGRISAEAKVNEGASFYFTLT